MVTKKYNSKSVKGFNLPLFAKQIAEHISSFEMWLFGVLWVAQSIPYFLRRRRYREIAGRHMGRRHKRKGSNVSGETQGRGTAIGQGLLATSISGWGKAHLLPWGFQKEAGTVHTSVAFLLPPGLWGDKCLLCKASMFAEIGYCICRHILLLTWEINIYQDEVSQLAGADFK